MLSVSCTFDKMFLHPVKLEPGSQDLIVTSAATGEEIIIKLDKSFRPEFYDLEGIKLFESVSIESVFFRNNYNDNLLHSWDFHPKEYNGITLLFLHGNAGNVTNHFQIAMPLAEQGFRVFLPDYSGFGLSEGKATRRTVLKDAESALGYMNDSLKIPSKELFIYGQSLGGNLAGHLASIYPECFSGLIIEGAFNSHKDIAAHATGLGFIARLLTKELYSSEKSVKKVSKPVLIIHSTQDEVIPFKMGKSIYESANDPKYFLKIDKRHIHGPIHYPEIITERIMEMKLMMRKNDFE